MKNKLIHKVVALLFALVATVAMGTVSAFASNNKPPDPTGQIADIAGSIESLVNSISGVQGQFNDDLVNVPNTITGTVSNLTGQASDITGAGSTVQGQITDALVNVPNTIVGTLSSLQGMFNDAFVNTPNTVTGTVSNLTGQVSDITGAGSTVQGQVTDALVNVPNTVTGTVDNVVNTGSTVQGQVTDALVNVPNTVSGTVSNVTGQVNDITTVPGNLTAPLSNIGSFMSGLGDLSSQLVNYASVPGTVAEGTISQASVPEALFDASKLGNKILVYYLGEGAGAESVLSPFHNPIAKSQGVKEATDKYGPAAAPYGYIKGELTADYRQAAAKELASYGYEPGTQTTANLELDEDTLNAFSQVLANNDQQAPAEVTNLVEQAQKV